MLSVGVTIRGVQRVQGAYYGNSRKATLREPRFAESRFPDWPFGQLLRINMSDPSSQTLGIRILKSIRLLGETLELL